MRTIGFLMLFYGKQHLKQAIESVIPFCEKIVVVYTNSPSHGASTDLICPDTKEELKAICDAFPNVEWHEINGAAAEHYHTEEIYKYAQGYDLIFRFDSDEVFDYETTKEALEEIEQRPERFYAPDGFRHYWKGDTEYLTDGFRPVRFEKLNADNTTAGEVCCIVNHYGYAISDDLMKYKLSIHGHKNELRPEWYQEIWLGYNENTRFLHPTSKTIWEKPVKK